MKQLGNEYILNSRELIRGVIQRGDDQRQMTSRVHATLRFYGPLFPPEPHASRAPRAADRDHRLGSRQVLAFGAAMWAALSA